MRQIKECKMPGPRQASPSGDLQNLQISSAAVCNAAAPAKAEHPPSFFLSPKNCSVTVASHGILLWSRPFLVLLLLLFIF